MPTRCWIAPEMPSARYSFGATVWPELPTWRSIGSQPASQIGRDAASSAPSASASCCASGDVLLPLDAAADRDDALGLRQIDRLLRLLERRLGLLADRRRVDGRRRARAPAPAPRPWPPASARNAPIWNVTRCGAGPCGTTSAVSLPWNIGRANAASPPAALIAGDVGDERAVEPRGQLRREVARLVGVRQQHERRRQLRRSRPAAPRRSRPACSALERRVLDGDDFRRPAPRRARAATPSTPAPSTAIVDRRRRRQLLRRGDRFPRRAIQRAVALFGDDEDHAITRASSRSRAHQLLARPRPASPAISCVFLAFSGT